MMTLIVVFLLVAVGTFLFYKCRKSGTSCCGCGSTAAPTETSKPAQKNDEPKKPGCGCCG